MMFFFMVRTTPSKETLLYLASYTTLALSYIIFYLHNTVDESERDSTGISCHHLPARVHDRPDTHVGRRSSTSPMEPMRESSAAQCRRNSSRRYAILFAVLFISSGPIFNVTRSSKNDIFSIFFNA
jgi:hypothetical protein